MKRQIRVKVQGTWHTVEVEEPQPYPFRVTVDGQTMEVEVDAEEIAVLSAASRPTAAEVAAPVGLAAITRENERLIRSPLPGRIVSVAVKVWDQVSPGAEVCILETMKMEQSVRVSHRGTVRAVFVTPGHNVFVGEPLIQLE